MGKKVRQLLPCVCCRRIAPHDARRLCVVCYSWFRKHKGRKRQGRSLSQFPPGRNRLWTAAELANALEMTARGLTATEISWILGRTRKGVRRKLEKYLVCRGT